MNETKRQLLLFGTNYYFCHYLFVEELVIDYLFEYLKFEVTNSIVSFFND